MLRPPHSRFARSLRVWPLVSLVLLLSLTPVGCGSGGRCTVSTCPGTWPQFRFDASHTGFNPYETRLSPANVGTMTKYWSSFIGGGPVYTSPAAADGLVYISSGSNVYALEPASGNVKWKRPIGFAASSSPAVADGLVYISSAAGDGVNLQGPGMYALNAANGTVKWTSPFGGGGYSSPAVVNNVVYVGSYDYVDALDAASGTMKWEQRISSVRGVTSSPAVANGVVYIGSNDGNVYAFH
jgi:outer membrane protein assembly factor BamB